MLRVPRIESTSRLMIWAAVRSEVRLTTSSGRFPGTPPVQLAPVFQVKGPAPVGVHVWVAALVGRLHKPRQAIIRSAQGTLEFFRNQVSTGLPIRFELGVCEGVFISVRLRGLGTEQRKWSWTKREQQNLHDGDTAESCRTVRESEL